jgi:hypothetical protein
MKKEEVFALDKEIRKNLKKELEKKALKKKN